MTGSRQLAALAGGGLSLLLLIAGLSADPLLTAAAFLFVALVLLAIYNLTYALALFTLVSFADAFPALTGVITPIKVVGLTLALGWLFHLRYRQDQRNIFTTTPALVLAVGLFLAYAVLSLLWSGYPDTALLTLARLIPNILLLAIVFTAIDSRRDMLLILAAYLLGSLGTAFFGVVLPIITAQSLSRLAGLAGDANYAAAQLLSALPIGVALIILVKTLHLRIAISLATLASLAGLVATGSRGALIAGLIASVVAIISVGSGYRLRATALAAALAAVALAMLVTIAPPSARERVAELPQSVSGQQANLSETSVGRTELWRVASQMGLDNPVGGVGVGQFPNNSGSYSYRLSKLERTDFLLETPKVAHNAYLQVLAEVGFIGLGLFLLVIVSSFVLLRRSWRRADPNLRVIVAAITVAWTALLAINLFVSNQYSQQLWLLLALIPALYKLALINPPPTNRENNDPVL